MKSEVPPQIYHNTDPNVLRLDL